MNSEIRNNLDRPRPAAEPAAVDHEALLRQLLQEMVAGIRRYLATPLQEMIDSVGITTVARRNLSNSVPGGATVDQLPSWSIVEVTLNRLVCGALHDGLQNPAAENLQDAECSCGARLRLCGGDENDSTAASNRTSGGESADLLPLWLETFFHVMREVHPRAIEIVQLRLDGYDCRDVAERLGLGLRLVRRMIHDLHSAWQQAAERSES